MPLVKVGSVFEIRDGMYENVEGAVIYDLNEIETLVSEGWFEEVDGMKKLYKPKLTLKEIVIQLAIIIVLTNPGYEPQIKDLIDEMDKWGKPA